MDFGQMLIWHVTLLPGAVGIVVALHILLVRRRGVVPPLPLRRDAAADLAASGPVPAGEEA
jgi:ubiquinol-cytochrome c reductase cytochrome b subunit